MEIWLGDFEFVARPGERPEVVCLVAHELRSGRTLGLWRDELGPEPPYRTDSNVLFVSFVANAECACHLALGWPMPKRVLDLNPAFRNWINGCQTPEGKGLIGALRYYGLDAMTAKQKDAMLERVMAGPPFTASERQRILDYCAGDTEALRRLLPKILADPEFDFGVALYHGEFAAVSALMEHRGVPIDMEVFSQLADEKMWREVRDAMVPAIDARYGVYVRNAAGDWTFSMERFAAYTAREGIAWPLLESGKLNMRRTTFEDMSKGFPQLEELRQLRHARDKMRKVKLAVGADGRNRTVLWPFQAKTSRTQPKASRWIFSPAVWLRSLIKPEPGMAVAYIDYSSMEFLIAASLSDRHCGPINNMLKMYQSGDPYLSFAKAVGAIPSWGSKQTHGEIRDKYKVMLLASQYGMSTETLAARLGVSTFEAHEMLNQHRAANRWRVDVEFLSGATQRIWLRWSPCNFGGHRPWLVCHRCNRTVGKLYNTGSSLNCRRCLSLWYASQRRGAKSRRYLRALKLRLRLNGIANLREPFPPRPKRMHRKTYVRLRRLGERLEKDLRDNPRFRDRETDYGPLVPK